MQKWLMPSTMAISFSRASSNLDVPSGKRSGYIPVRDASITSMYALGICRCGCSLNIAAAASCDSASTTRYQLRSFLASVIPS